LSFIRYSGPTEPHTLHHCLVCHTYTLVITNPKGWHAVRTDVLSLQASEVTTRQLHIQERARREPHRRLKRRPGAQTVAMVACSGNVIHIVLTRTMTSQKRIHASQRSRRGPWDTQIRPAPKNPRTSLRRLPPSRISDLPYSHSGSPSPSDSGRQESGYTSPPPFRYQQPEISPAPRRQHSHNQRLQYALIGKCRHVLSIEFN
jgi:hypothetical protein